MKNILFLIAFFTVSAFYAQQNDASFTANGFDQPYSIAKKIDESKLLKWSKEKQGVSPVFVTDGFIKLKMEELPVSYTSGGVEEELMFNGTATIVIQDDQSLIDFAIVSAEIDGYAFSLTGGGMGGSFFSNSGKVRSRALLYRKAIERYVFGLIKEMEAL